MAAEAKAQFGSDVRREVKRVYYEGTRTIQEGEPMCYNFNTTSNILGYDKANSTFGQSVVESATTAEGYQNEGKYLRVENPSSDNLAWFAGAVAPGNWCGLTGPKWIEVYTPNGSIVPLRTSVSSTVGVTIVGIKASTYTFCAAGDGVRPVALLEETVDRSSTNGLCLGQLSPNMFLFQGAQTATAFSGTSDIVVNKINVTSAQTAGRFTALWVQAAITSTSGSYNGYALALYTEADISGVVNGATAGTAAWLNLTAGTQIEPITALQVGFYESGATVSSSNILSVLQLTSQFAENPASLNHAWIYLEENGTYAPDTIFRCVTAGDISASASTSEPTWGTSHLKVPFIATAGTQYYVHATAD